MSSKRIEAPFGPEVARGLRAGDTVLLSGRILTGRDAAHKRLFDLLQAGKPLPVDLRDQLIYYVGPAPAKPGQVIGSAGPTTSLRMDPFAPALMAAGMRGMIGKGSRARAVRDAIIEYDGVYLAAVGGAGALIAKSIVGAKVVAYEDLGPEAVYELTVRDFPAVVINDTAGGDLYEMGVERYRREEPAGRRD
jgi:fumarate hydratase subunit beta